MLTWIPIDTDMLLKALRGEIRVGSDKEVVMDEMDAVRDDEIVIEVVKDEKPKAARKKAAKKKVAKKKAAGRKK